MSEIIRNRYDFVVLFDSGKPGKSPTAILTQMVCPASILRPAAGW